MEQAIAFYTLAAFILGLAVLVVTAKNAVHSVVYLVLDFLAVAALYVTLRAQFLAVVQILVYAGGIVVLYLFVVMLVSQKSGPESHRDPRRQARAGVGLAVALLAELGAVLLWQAYAPQAAVAEGTAVGSVEHIGLTLYTDYLIPFEVASVLLLVAMVGAIVLAKREP